MSDYERFEAFLSYFGNDTEAEQAYNVSMMLRDLLGAEFTVIDGELSFCFTYDSIGEVERIRDYLLNNKAQEPETYEELIDMYDEFISKWREADGE